MSIKDMINVVLRHTERKTKIDSIDIVFKTIHL